LLLSHLEPSCCNLLRLLLLQQLALLLTLLHMLPVLLLSCGKRDGQEEISKQPLALRNSRSHRQCHRQLLKPLQIGCRPTQVHSIDSGQAHNTPHTFVQSRRTSHPHCHRTHHAQDVLRLQLPREPTNQLLLQHINNSPGHRTRPEMVTPAGLTAIH
jgi:hypothetical protein